MKSKLKFIIAVLLSLLMVQQDFCAAAGSWPTSRAPASATAAASAAFEQEALMEAIVNQERSFSPPTKIDESQQLKPFEPGEKAAIPRHEDTAWDVFRSAVSGNLLDGWDSGKLSFVDEVPLADAGNAANRAVMLAWLEQNHPQTLSENDKKILTSKFFDSLIDGMIVSISNAGNYSGQTANHEIEAMTLQFSPEARPVIVAMIERFNTKVLEVEVILRRYGRELSQKENPDRRSYELELQAEAGLTEREAVAGMNAYRTELGYGNPGRLPTEGNVLGVIPVSSFSAVWRNIQHHFFSQSLETWAVSLAFIGIVRVLWKKLQAYHNFLWNQLPDAEKRNKTSVFSNERHQAVTGLAGSLLLVLHTGLLLYRHFAHTHVVPYFGFLDWAPDVTLPAVAMQFALFSYSLPNPSTPGASRRLVHDPLYVIRTIHQLILIAFIVAKIIYPLLDSNPLQLGHTFDIQDIAAYCVSALLSVSFHTWMWTRRWKEYLTPEGPGTPSNSPPLDLQPNIPGNRGAARFTIDAIDRTIASAQTRLEQLGIERIPDFAIRPMPQRLYRANTLNPYGASTGDAGLWMVGVNARDFMTFHSEELYPGEKRERVRGFLDRLYNTFITLQFGDDNPAQTNRSGDVTAYIVFTQLDFRHLYAGERSSDSTLFDFSTPEKALSHEATEAPRWQSKLYTSSIAATPEKEAFAIRLSSEELAALIREGEHYWDFVVIPYLELRNIPIVEGDRATRDRVINRYITYYLYAKFLEQLAVFAEAHPEPAVPERLLTPSGAQSRPEGTQVAPYIGIIPGEFVVTDDLRVAPIAVALGSLDAPPSEIVVTLYDRATRCGVLAQLTPVQAADPKSYSRLLDAMKDGGIDDFSDVKADLFERGSMTSSQPRDNASLIHLTEAMRSRGATFPVQLHPEEFLHKVLFDTHTGVTMVNEWSILDNNLVALQTLLMHRRMFRHDPSEALLQIKSPEERQSPLSPNPSSLVLEFPGVAKLPPVARLILGVLGLGGEFYLLPHTAQSLGHAVSALMPGISGWVVGPTAVLAAALLIMGFVALHRLSRMLADLLDKGKLAAPAAVYWTGYWKQVAFLLPYAFLASPALSPAIFAILCAIAWVAHGGYDAHEFQIFWRQSPAVLPRDSKEIADRSAIPQTEQPGALLDQLQRSGIIASGASQPGSGPILMHPHQNASELDLTSEVMQGFKWQTAAPVIVVVVVGLGLLAVFGFMHGPVLLTLFGVSKGVSVAMLPLFKPRGLSVSPTEQASETGPFDAAVTYFNQRYKMRESLFRRWTRLPLETLSILNRAEADVEMTHFAQAAGADLELNPLLREIKNVKNQKMDHDVTSVFEIGNVQHFYAPYMRAERISSDVLAEAQRTLLAGALMSDLRYLASTAMEEPDRMPERLDMVERLFLQFQSERRGNFYSSFEEFVAFIGGVHEDEHAYLARFNQLSDYFASKGPASHRRFILATAHSLTIHLSHMALTPDYERWGDESIDHLDYALAFRLMPIFNQWLLQGGQTPEQREETLLVAAGLLAMNPMAMVHDAMDEAYDQNPSRHPYRYWMDTTTFNGDRRSLITPEELATYRRVIPRMLPEIMDFVARNERALSGEDGYFSPWGVYSTFPIELFYGILGTRMGSPYAPFIYRTGDFTRLSHDPRILELGRKPNMTQFLGPNRGLPFFYPSVAQQRVELLKANVEKLKAKLGPDMNVVAAERSAWQTAAPVIVVAAIGLGLLAVFGFMHAPAMIAAIGLGNAAVAGKGAVSLALLPMLGRPRHLLGTGAPVSPTFSRRDLGRVLGLGGLAAATQSSRGASRKGVAWQTKGQRQNLAAWGRYLQALILDPYNEEALDELQKAAEKSTADFLRESGDVEWANHLRAFVAAYGREQRAQQQFQMVEKFNESVLRPRGWMFVWNQNDPDQPFLLGSIKHAGTAEVESSEAGAPPISRSIPFWSGDVLDLETGNFLKNPERAGLSGKRYGPPGQDRMFLYEAGPQRIRLHAQEAFRRHSPIWTKTNESLAAAGFERDMAAEYREALISDGMVVGGRLHKDFETHVWEEGFLSHEVAHSLTVGSSGIFSAEELPQAEAFAHLQELRGLLAHVLLMENLLSAINAFSEANRNGVSDYREIPEAILFAALARALGREDLANSVENLSFKALFEVHDLIKTRAVADIDRLAQQAQNQLTVPRKPPAQWNFRMRLRTLSTHVSDLLAAAASRLGSGPILMHRHQNASKSDLTPEADAGAEKGSDTQSVVQAQRSNVGARKNYWPAIHLTASALVSGSLFLFAFVRLIFEHHLYFSFLQHGTFLWKIDHYWLNDFITTPSMTALFYLSAMALILATGGRTSPRFVKRLLRIASAAFTAFWVATKLKSLGMPLASIPATGSPDPWDLLAYTLGGVITWLLIGLASYAFIRTGDTDLAKLDSAKIKRTPVWAHAPTLSQRIGIYLDEKTHFMLSPNYKSSVLWASALFSFSLYRLVTDTFHLRIRHFHSIVPVLFPLDSLQFKIDHGYLNDGLSASAIVVSVYSLIMGIPAFVRWVRGRELTPEQMRGYFFVARLLLWYVNFAAILSIYCNLFLSKPDNIIAYLFGAGVAIGLTASLKFPSEEAAFLVVWNDFGLLKLRNTPSRRWMYAGA